MIYFCYYCSTSSAMYVTPESVRSCKKILPVFEQEKFYLLEKGFTNLSLFSNVSFHGKVQWMFIHTIIVNSSPGTPELRLTLAGNPDVTYICTSNATGKFTTRKMTILSPLVNRILNQADEDNTSLKLFRTQY